jgi:steroid delta-isomerase-like uncharacterized protein
LTFCFLFLLKLVEIQGISINERLLRVNPTKETDFDSKRLCFMLHVTINASVGSAMSNAANKELVRNYFDEVWNKGNLEKESEFVAQDIVVHPPPVQVPSGITLTLQIVSAFRAALPDLVLVNDLLFGDGDRVVQHFVATGTHSGAQLFGVPASGRTLTISGINIFRIANGKLVERWGTFDAAGLMQQLHAG